ncbi:MAG: C39 family peptidase [Candidatus Moranbacteria bacterium]|nr:C39 family peptidase [Candidatus Moranbacteria bacterium]
MKGHNIYPSVILPVHRHLQYEEYTCGPASLRIIVETLNGRDKLPSELEIAKLCGTNPKTGTDPDRMVSALESLGVEHVVQEQATLQTIEECIRRFQLCLVDFQAHDDGSKDGHYSVVFGFDETHFFIADPYKKKGMRNKEWGFRRIRKDLFEQRWHARHIDGVRVVHWMVAVPFVR